MNAPQSTLVALIALFARTARAGRRAGRGPRDAGASALEFAIIGAIVVVAASVIGAVIYNIVDTKATQLETCAGQTIDAKCAP